MNSEVIDILETVLHTNAIAVAGASDDVSSFGYHFMRYLLDYDYTGHVYPVNPSRQAVFGLKAYPNLSSLPEPVDYVICCLPASKVPDMLAECPARGIKVVHLYTARLSETGQPEAKELDARILQEAKRLNVRLIGPNCMGIYYPRGRISFGYDFPKEAGTIGAVFGFDNKYVLIGTGNNVGPLDPGQGFWLSCSEDADVVVDSSE